MPPSQPVSKDDTLKALLDLRRTLSKKFTEVKTLFDLEVDPTKNSQRFLIMRRAKSALDEVKLTVTALENEDIQFNPPSPQQIKKTQQLASNLEQEQFDTIRFDAQLKLFTDVAKLIEGVVIK